ncbi:MAG: MarR family winged helix-turn-helix transcriptional regulator [Neisseriaceae bacterium]
MKEKLKNNMLREIDAIARESHAIYEAKFRNHNLQRGQFLFLTRICETPGISLKELSYELKMDKTTVTKAVKKLITAGYINKEIDKIDKRILHLNPTNKCLYIYNDIIFEKNRIINICLNNIDNEDYEIFNKVINAILENLNKEWEKVRVIKK